MRVLERYLFVEDLCGNFHENTRDDFRDTTEQPNDF